MYTHMQKLPNDPIVKHNKVISDATEKFKQEQQLIPKATAEALKLKDWKAPKFQMLPKINKISNPGRLAVSSIGCHSTNDFKVYWLPPATNCLLVNMDLKPMYTKIPN